MRGFLTAGVLDGGVVDQKLGDNARGTGYRSLIAATMMPAWAIKAP